MKKVIFFLAIATIGFWLFSCSDENHETEEVATISSEEIIPSYTGKGFDFTIVYNRGEYSDDQIFGHIASVFASEFELGTDLSSEIEKDGTSNSNLLGASLNINISPTQVVVTPLPSDPSITYSGDDSDDKKCGGKEGEGWKSYGTCVTEKCVQEKMVDAAADKASELGAGQCMDIRVKRNSLNARVCARVISC